MRHIIFEESIDSKYKIALLIKDSAFKPSLLEKHYISKLEGDINKNSIIGLSLKYNEKGKIPVKFIKEQLDTILKACNYLNINTLLVADSNYFKALTGVTKVENYHGDILDCKLKEYEHIKVILSINYQSLFYNPDLQQRLDMSLDTLIKHTQGTINLKPSIIHKAEYPSDYYDIKQTLNHLHDYDVLTCDIETYALRHYKAGIGTIAFAWNQHEGVAFQVDREPLNYNAEVRNLLRNFFESYKGKLIFHNAGFDVTVLIYQLWMNNITDIMGLYIGLDIMTRNFECTQLITYLATNSCAGNKLSLKYNAFEFAGNYAIEEIEDITQVDINKLLEYNLIDCLCTWFVLNKYKDVLIQDNQVELYKGLMKDSLITIIQMQLTGMPICMDRVFEVEQELSVLANQYSSNILSSSLVDDTVDILKQRYLDKDFKDRKDKAKNPDKIKPKVLSNINIDFNPNSGSQVAVLLYEVMDLPIIETTKGGSPATDEKTLKNLINHATKDSDKELIRNILDLGKVNKILTTFIPAFKEAQLGSDGHYYLFGSYKLGGTISGRIASSKPNLMQIPSGSTYGKLVKSCFKSNKEWLFAGSDFANLEARINALLTKDMMKLAVYTDGFDSHCLASYFYFKDQMPDITEELQGYFDDREE